MKRKFIEWADKYEVEGFIANDPVQFPRKHIGKRAEISGFITSWLSFGNRKAIIKAADWLDKDFCDDPYCWLMTKQYNFYYNDHRKFYRFLSYDDLYRLGDRLHRLYEDFERMEDMVVAWSDKTPVQALSAYFNGINGIPDYDKGSACKRLCMFLRWMVRRNSPVDMGVWRKVSPDSLIVPLDTHVHRMALELGFDEQRSYAVISTLFIDLLKQHNREMDKLLAEKLNDRNLAPSIVPPLIQHLHTGMVAFAGVEGKFDYREQNVVTAMKVIKNRIDSIEFSVF